MNTYDYRNCVDNVGKLLALADTLSDKEADMALTAIENARETNLEEKRAEFSAWFDVSILVILKEFASLTASVLEIEKPSDTHIVATISNNSGLDISEDCKMMKFAMSFAVHIAVNVHEGIAVLTLIYDCV